MIPAAHARAPKRPYTSVGTKKKQRKIEEYRWRDVKEINKPTITPGLVNKSPFMNFMTHQQPDGQNEIVSGSLTEKAA